MCFTYRSQAVANVGAVKVCRDPNDDMFLKCAAVARSDLLVAGDKDLLTLGAYKGRQIVSPSTPMACRRVWVSQLSAPSSMRSGPTGA
ncbi:MAG: putative toxin-antitoxin system toxin component, PIN family [Acidobacteriota bacterium]